MGCRGDSCRFALIMQGQDPDDAFFNRLPKVWILRVILVKRHVFTTLFPHDLSDDGFLRQLPVLFVGIAFHLLLVNGALP